MTDVLKSAADALTQIADAADLVLTQGEEGGYTESAAFQLTLALGNAREVASRALAALNEVASAQIAGEGWSQDVSGAIWSEIRSGLTGHFEARFVQHIEAKSYEMSSAYLDECARILTRRIEDKLWPAPPAPAQTDTLANQEPNND